MARPEVIALLGGARMFRDVRLAAGARGQPAASGLGERKLASYHALERLGGHLGMEPVAVLRMLGVSVRTAARRRQSGYLSEQETDRLLRLARVVQYAMQVLGSPAKARMWLMTAHPQLGDRVPLALLGTDEGAEAVTDELTRIEFGDFA